MLSIISYGVTTFLFATHGLLTKK